MTPESLARLVERRGQPGFLELLRGAASDFETAGFEPALANAIRSEPRLAARWSTWSADQRWTPGAYVEGNESGWYDTGHRHVRADHDAADAVADFIHRMTAWIARREIVAADE